MPQRDGPSCPGCGLPNYEGLCPVCRGDYPGYVEELQPHFGPWESAPYLGRLTSFTCDRSVADPRRNRTVSSQTEGKQAVTVAFIVTLIVGLPLLIALNIRQARRRAKKS